LGNQIDCGTAIDFLVTHTASPIATGGNAMIAFKLKYENYILLEFCQFFQYKGINRETETSL